jgi:hypothetical protein
MRAYTHIHAPIRRSKSVEDKGEGKSESTGGEEVGVTTYTVTTYTYISIHTLL